MRIGKHLFAIKIPPLSQRGGRGRFSYSNLSKINLPNLFTKEGLFYDVLLLVVLLKIYLRELRTESIYLPLKYPLFRKEGAGGDSLLQLIQNQFAHHFNMGFFSIQCGDIVIRYTTMI